MLKIIGFLLLFSLAACNTDLAEPPKPQPHPKNKFGWDSYNGTLSMIDALNINEMRRGAGAVIAGFFDPSCDACNDFVVFMEQVWHHFVESGRWSLNIGLINVRTEKTLPKLLEITKVPTIVAFTNINRFYYEKSMNLQELETFVHQVLFPRKRELESNEHLFLVEKCYLCALIVSPDVDQRQVQWLGEVGVNHLDVALHYAFESKTGPFEGKSGSHALFLYRAYDDGLKVLSSNETLTYKQMADFLDLYVPRRLQEVSMANIDRIISKEETSFFLFTNDTQSDASQTFRQLALEKLGVTWAVGVWGEEFVGNWSQFLGVRESEGEAAVLIRFENGVLIKHRPASLSRDSLVKFLDDFKTSVLPIFYKSEEVPAIQSDQIKIVVGQNFDEIVTNNDQHVLLLVTAWYCPHSKRAQEAFEELADRMEPVPGLVLAKMEGTENEHPSLAMKTFPLIKLYRGFDKQVPLDYDKERFVDSIREFLEKETGSKIILREKASPVSDEL
jgi:hypothetical protein